MKLILVGFVALIGMFIAFQPIANGRISAAAGAPVAGAISNFIVGIVALGLVVVSGVAGRPNLSTLGQAPWWAWTGGLIGATFVTSMILVVPRIGAVTAFAAIIMGQLIGSAVIDNFGLFGMPSVTLSPLRGIGLALIVVGVFLTQR
ncbi:MAG: DMT family transporter [Myxococcota bacterium]